MQKHERRKNCDGDRSNLHYSFYYDGSFYRSSHARFLRWKGSALPNWNKSWWNCSDADYWHVQEWVTKFEPNLKFSNSDLSFIDFRIFEKLTISEIFYILKNSIILLKLRKILKLRKFLKISKFRFFCNLIQKHARFSRSFPCCNFQRHVEFIFILFIRQRSRHASDFQKTFFFKKYLWRLNLQNNHAFYRNFNLFFVNRNVDKSRNAFGNFIYDNDKSWRAIFWNCFDWNVRAICKSKRSYCWMFCSAFSNFDLYCTVSCL